MERREAAAASVERREAPAGFVEPSPAETARELAPGWDSESSQRLADWASGGPSSEEWAVAPAADTTQWWKPPQDDPSAGPRQDPSAGGPSTFGRRRRKG